MRLWRLNIEWGKHSDKNRGQDPDEDLANYQAVSQIMTLIRESTEFEGQALTWSKLFRSSLKDQALYHFRQYSDNASIIQRAAIKAFQEHMNFIANLQTTQEEEYLVEASGKFFIMCNNACRYLSDAFPDEDIDTLIQRSEFDGSRDLYMIILKDFSGVVEKDTRHESLPTLDAEL